MTFDPDLDMALAALDAQADLWAAEIDLNAMIENVTSPMKLNQNVPDDVRASFAKRMKEQIDALIRQAFIEGAVRASDGFAPEDAE